MFYLSNTESLDAQECSQVAKLIRSNKKNKIKSVGKIYLIDDDSKDKAQSIMTPKLPRSEASTEITVFPFFKNKPKQNHRILVTGASGSGKSTFISMVLADLILQKSKHEGVSAQEDQEEIRNFSIGEVIKDEIIIISAIQHDEALDKQFGGKSPIRLSLNSANVDQIEPKHFVNCIIIFDDIENYSKDKSVKKFLNQFRAECFETCRHYSTDLISVSHKVLGGTINATIKSECTSFVCFPKYNQHHEISSYLSEYLGFKGRKGQLFVNYVLETIPEKYDSRFVCINKTAPMVLIHSHGVELINSLVKTLTAA